METTKKILMVLLAITLVLLFMSTCREVDQQNKDVDIQDSITMDDRSNKAPKEIITVAQAKFIFDGYTKRRVPIITEFENRQQKEEDFAPTRYAHYDYATIKQYMAYIEREAKLAGVEISTLRFYFANYPEAEKFPDGRGIKYPKQNTFFIVPTLDQDGKEFGFYTIKGEGDKRKAALIIDKIKSIGTSQLPVGAKLNEVELNTASFNPASLFSSTRTAMPFFDDENSLILNEGGLVPPPPKEGSDFQQ